MKQLLTLFIVILSSAAFFSCGSDDTTSPETPVDSLAQYKTQGQQLQRTIIAYLTADNNLSSDLSTDLTEMITGSKTLPEYCRLIVFADMTNKSPYIAEIRKGRMTTMKTYANDFFSVSPDSMLSIMQWIVKNYPANEYATIMEGHGSGAIINQDSVKTNLFSMKAYGYDNTPSGGNSQWLNIPSMAKVFSYLPKMKFIFMDCCCMGNAETAYQLRNATEYLIAPVCETPAKGAPYDKIIPLLYSSGIELSKSIIDTYANSITNTNVGGICLTAINTSELTTFATNTKYVLQKMYANCGKTKLDILNLYKKKPIYYYRDVTTYGTPVLQDMKCTFRLAVDSLALISQSDFDTWCESLNKVVVYKSTPDKSRCYPTLWITNTDSYPNINFYDFYDIFDDKHYGGISMIFPDSYYDKAQPSYPSVNNTMFKLQWCNVVGWHDYGW